MRAGGRTFSTRSRECPAVANIGITTALQQSFRKTTAESITLIQTIYFTFSVIVAFGVVYNSARIALSERSRDLATLRVVGFTNREVAGVLISELVMLTAAAIPAGLWIGGRLASWIVLAASTETIRLPLILTHRTYATAILIVLLSAGVSFYVVSRRIRNLDLLGVLKPANNENHDAKRHGPDRKTKHPLAQARPLRGRPRARRVHRHRPHAQAVEVEMDSVARGPLTVSVLEDGKTRIRNRYVVSPSVAGYLRRVPVRAGDPIVAGETLLAVIQASPSSFLDPRARAQAEAAVRSAEAALQQRNEQAQSATAELDLARKELVRAEQLRTKGAIAVQEFDTASNHVEGSASRSARRTSRSRWPS